MRGSCIGDLSAEREGRFRGSGRVPRGVVRQIGSAQPLPMAEKSGCSDALGCPECGPPIAAHGRVFFGDVASVPVSEGVIPGNTYIYVYTYLYIHIHASTIIYVHIHAYTYIHTFTYIYRYQRIAVWRCFLAGAADALGHLDGL